MHFMDGIYGIMVYRPAYNYINYVDGKPHELIELRLAKGKLE